MLMETNSWIFRENRPTASRILRRVYQLWFLLKVSHHAIRHDELCPNIDGAAAAAIFAS